MRYGAAKQNKTGGRAKQSKTDRRIHKVREKVCVREAAREKRKTYTELSDVEKKETKKKAKEQATASAALSLTTVDVPVVIFPLSTDVGLGTHQAYRQQASAPRSRQCSRRRATRESELQQNGRHGPWP